MNAARDSNVATDPELTTAACLDDTKPPESPTTLSRSTTPTGSVASVFSGDDAVTLANSRPGSAFAHYKFHTDHDPSTGLDVDDALLEKQSLTTQRPSRIASFVPTLRCGIPNLRSWLRNALFSLLPSYISHRGASRTDRRGGIVALDGLRGLACLIVFNEHLTYNIHYAFLYPYGYAEVRTGMQFPFIRIFWSGFSMVTIFFIISGYVLSSKFLHQIRTNQHSAAYRTLTSSVVRRVFRLYIPVAAAIFIIGFMSWMGAFEPAIRVIGEDNPLQLHEPPAPRAPELWVQMWDCVLHVITLMNVWSPAGIPVGSIYDLHNWTIPIEFANSIILSVILLALSRFKDCYRIWSTILIAAMACFTRNRNMLLFLCGMLLADVDQSLKLMASTRPMARLVRATTSSSSYFWPIMFIWGIWICCVPVCNPEFATEYRFLLRFVPEGWSERAEWVRVPGASLIVWSVANSDVLKPLFTNAVMTYLGKVSFALYLVHGVLLRTILHAALPTIYTITGDGTKVGQTQIGMIMAWVFAVILMTPITFWMSDLFWRAVDIPSVSIAKWLENKMSKSEDELLPTNTPKGRIA